MSQWYVINKKADFKAIAEKFNIDPVIARIMRNREIIISEEQEQYLYGTKKEFHSYKGLKDMEKALQILSKKIKNRQKIRIIGDYDVDGVCATYILFKGISLCGGNVDTIIPQRIRDGYGINDMLIEDAVIQEIDTIITCDNGISAAASILKAKNEGLTCIVTDHHEVPYEEDNEGKRYILPPADAVIDPKQPDCTYPFQEICGAFVAYKLIEGLFDIFHIDKENKKELLELAGVATVCDVMQLTDENRTLVKITLEGMKSAGNAGLKALMHVNELNTQKLSSYHLGFILGPCINATGRMDTAEIALELLQSESFEKAVPIAVKLKQLNDSRKQLTESGVENAIAIIEKNGWMEDKIIVVYLCDLHESLAGIVAGRIREKYGKPTFVLTKGKDEIKGSGRSIEKYSLYEEMVKCKEYFTQFGGHKMAAGLSMKEENIDEFRRKINALCALDKEDYEEKILIDVPMPLSYVTEKLIKQMSLLEPFGPGNSKPVFAQKKLHFVHGRKMGKGNMAKFFVEDEDQRKYEVVLFRGLEQFEECLDLKYGSGAAASLFESAEEDRQIYLDIVYYPALNEYRGKSSIQFILQDYK